MRRSDREALARLEASGGGARGGGRSDREALARVESTVAEVAEAAADREALARVEEALGGLAERVAAVASDESPARIAARLRGAGGGRG